MKKTVQKLKGNGIKITPQRAEIYRILAADNNHLTVEEIYAKIKKRFPAVSQATVYCVLELYCRKNMASEIRINFERSCFEVRTDSHHHFYCKTCKRIFDIDLHPCPALKNKETGGHKIEKLHGYFYGQCRYCRKK
ncbi:MAG: transcriptional repressor [Candidatus Omnitrophica bacterium]|nr:transcriptional repressor [Candidatus Omnitrophota bacterium]